MIDLVAASDAPASDAPSNTCGDASCEFEWQCKDGGCCPFLRACLQTCCREDEHCNVYQCYRPLLCGPGLPACPTMTYCEDYEHGNRECARMGRSWAERNAEFCARMRAGGEWLPSHDPGPEGKRAVGVCLPVLPPHRMVGKWYRSMRKDAER